MCQPERRHSVLVARTLFQLLSLAILSYAWSGSDKAFCRRAAATSVLGKIAEAIAVTLPALAITEPDDASDELHSIDVKYFKSAAYGRQEYTNSIVASRDTNLSPAEAYDVIRQHIPKSSDTRRGAQSARAADIGAGAGLSTTILFAEKEYRTIDAVDWSRTAWDTSVSPESWSTDSVRFFEMDDASFFASLPTDKANEERYFDAIVYNFAVNREKAVWAAQNFLTTDGVLLAPCNDNTDYWYKQSYMLLDHTGAALWKSDASVGAWYIQFQPDVTSPTCTGIWCGSFNGFFKR
jgi:hypothetical protein